MSTSRTALVVATLVLVWTVERPVQAYLDPGTGSVVVQAIIATLVGALTVGRAYLRRAVAVFRGRRTKRGDAGQP